jgi:dihydrolipoamide dehydrogenase
MTQVVEIKIPDIGDFKDVPVIELFVAPGDKIEKETSLITLETDKASMEVPSPEAGVIQAVKVKVGDKVSEGSVILTLAVADQVTPSISTENNTPAASDRTAAHTRCIPNTC